MRYFLILTMFLSSSAFAECKWSEREVANEDAPSIIWRHCSDGKVVQKIEVSGITLTPTAKFIFEDPECPECREFYSTPSKSKNLTVISAGIQIMIQMFGCWTLKTKKSYISRKKFTGSIYCLSGLVILS
jgi:hypothetical protein